MEDIKAQFNRMLAATGEVRAADLPLVEELTREYPYCQSVKFLIARHKSVLGLPGADSSLALAAIYAPDRTVLFNYMNAKAQVTEPAAPTVPAFSESDFVLDIGLTEPAEVVAASEAVPGNAVHSLLSGNSIQQESLDTQQPASLNKEEEEINFRELQQSDLDLNPVPDEGLDQWAIKELDQLKDNLPLPEPSSPESKTEIPVAQPAAPVAQPAAPVAQPAAQALAASKPTLEQAPPRRFPAPVTESIKKLPEDSPPESGALKPESGALKKVQAAFNDEIPVRKTFLYWLKKTQKGYFLNSANADGQVQTPVSPDVARTADAPSHTYNSSIRLDPAEEIKKVHEVDSLEKTLQENLVQLGTADIYASQEIEFDLTKKEDLIIEKYLRQNQQHIKPNKTYHNEEEVERLVEKASSEDDLYTETIASILYQQQHYDKAIRAYEYLSLKKPEKSAFFTSLIEKIRVEANQSLKQ